MSSNPYQHLLDAETPPEAFVRRALGQLEVDFRDAALVTLAAWDAAEVVSPALFSAVASLQRPSWGSWNGLLAAVRKARREALQRGAAEVRGRVEAQAPLAAVIGLYDRRLSEAERDALAPLAALTRFKLSARSRFSDALAMPITLRNRVAHDAPSDPRWWQEAADALRPLVALHAAEAPLAKATADAPRPAPWFHEADGDVWTFAGVGRDFAVQYLSPQGASRYEGQASGPVLQAFQRLLGKADVVAKDLRKLLSKLAPEDIKGVALGDYLVGRPIGEGGFATVHVGTQLSTGRKVAVKLLRDGLPEEARLRFLQEAAFLSRFRHPHIVGVVGRGEEAWGAPRAFSLDEEPWYQALKKGASVKSYIAMEWVDGQTLDAVFRGPREERPASKPLLRWFSEAASALSAVHGMGLVHRDVKPANLMVSGDGAIKLMDFGIARSQEEDRTLMTMGGAVGTPAYMSPEQIRAADADSEVGPATDIYSLCATFYELFTGQRLYGHDTTPAETVKTAKLSGALPRSPRALVGGLPWEVEAILLGGLQPELSDRYASVDAVHQDIERVLRDEPIVYQKPSMWRRLQLGYRRNRLVSNLVAGFLLVAALGAWGWIWMLNHKNETIQREQAKAESQKRSANKQKQRAEEERANAVRQRTLADKRLQKWEREHSAWLHLRDANVSLHTVVAKQTQTSTHAGELLQLLKESKQNPAEQKVHATFQSLGAPFYAPNTKLQKHIDVRLEDDRVESEYEKILSPFWRNLGNVSKVRLAPAVFALLTIERFNRARGVVRTNWLYRGRRRITEASTLGWALSPLRTLCTHLMSCDMRSHTEVALLVAQTLMEFEEKALMKLSSGLLDKLARNPRTAEHWRLRLLQGRQAHLENKDKKQVINLYRGSAKAAVSRGEPLAAIGHRIFRKKSRRWRAKSKKQFERARNLGYDATPIALRMAWIAAYEDDWESAEKEASQVWNRLSDSEEDIEYGAEESSAIRIRLVARLHLNKKKDANADYQQIMKRWPDHRHEFWADILVAPWTEKIRPKLLRILVDERLSLPIRDAKRKQLTYNMLAKSCVVSGDVDEKETCEQLIYMAAARAKCRIFDHTNSTQSPPQCEVIKALFKDLDLTH